MQLARDILEKSVETFTNPFYSILLALCPWLADARQLKANIKRTRQVRSAVPPYIVPCHAVLCRAVPCHAVLCCAVLCCEVLCYPVNATSSDILAITLSSLTLCAMIVVVLAMTQWFVSPQTTSLCKWPAFYLHDSCLMMALEPC